jgi:hypothetical protein
MTTYIPKSIDTFNIGVENEIANVLIQGTLPLEHYQALHSLCFSVYAPAVITVYLEDSERISYTIAQSEDLVDLDWLHQALSRFEEGWTRRGNALFSPHRSKLSEKQVTDTFNAARRKLAAYT